MKKLLAISCVIVLLVSMTACTGSVDDGKFVGTYGMGKFIPAEMYAACYNGI